MSVRMGIYADAFPCFLNWYPTDPNQNLYFPSSGSIAYASREGLGEATAKLMVAGGHENEIVSSFLPIPQLDQAAPLHQLKGNICL